MKRELLLETFERLRSVQCELGPLRSGLFDDEPRVSVPSRRGERCPKRLRRLDDRDRASQGDLGRFVSLEQQTPIAPAGERPLSVDPARGSIERGARLALEAEQLLTAADEVGGARLVRHVLVGREVDEARQLANLLTAAGGVALWGVAGERAQLVFGRPATGAAFAHMGEAIKPALVALGGARGGGGAVSAQGGGPAADEATVATALAAAVAWLRAAANPVE